MHTTPCLQGNGSCLGISLRYVDTLIDDFGAAINRWSMTEKPHLSSKILLFCPHVENTATVTKTNVPGITCNFIFFFVNMNTHLAMQSAFTSICERMGRPK